MPRRPSIDLKSLTADQAAPMPEATQRNASLPLCSEPEKPRLKTKTENLQALAFKVPPEFRRRFRQRAVMADLKQNELLFAALTAWEEKNGLKK
ncbi:MAG: hypothetical protein JNK31_03640 [Candidatus Competibacter sp.]|nr:hypothetical protein [Candidatus Competibacter sp.]